MIYNDDDADDVYDVDDVDYDYNDDDHDYNDDYNDNDDDDDNYDNEWTGIALESVSCCGSGSRRPGKDWNRKSTVE